MGKELWEHVPPDSAVVLYLGCGDGRRPEALRRCHPDMRVYGVEQDEALRSQAEQAGIRVFADTLEAITVLAAEGQSLDAWIVERSAWQDATFTTHCRRGILHRLHPGATLVWEFASNQHWQYLLRLIAGKAGDERRLCLNDVIDELRSAEVVAVEVIEKIETKDAAFVQMVELLKPLATAMRWTQEQLEQRLAIDSIAVRGRYQQATDNAMAIRAVLGEPQVCARVRIDEPFSFMATLPRVSCSRHEPPLRFDFPPHGQRVWIWQRLMFPRDRMLLLQQQMLQQRVLTIQEWDDDPLHWETHFIQNDFSELRSAHAIQTSTPALAEYLRQFNPVVKVFPNCIASLPPLRFSDKPEVTLFFGALNRKPDWAPILPALNRVLQRYGSRIRVLVVFDREFFELVRCSQKQFVPFCVYSLYQEMLQQSDIALLPLLSNRFNRMKSDLKYLECAALGTVALANPTVYAETIQHGNTGLLYETETEFENYLTQLIEDTSLRKSLASNAWQWVKQNRLLSQHYRDRFEWYASLHNRYEELTEQIAARVPELRRGRV